MAFELTTVQLVKNILGMGESDTQDDTAMGVLIRGQSKAIETYLDRHFERTSRTVYFDVEDGQHTWWLLGILVTTITGVWHDTLREFGDSTLVDSDNYTCDEESGELTIDKLTMSSGDRVLKVTYTGGMATTEVKLQADYPDLAQACALQVAYTIQRRDSLGVQSFSAPGGAVAIWPGAGFVAPANWLPQVRQILDQHRRGAF